MKRCMKRGSSSVLFALASFFSELKKPSFAVSAFVFTWCVKALKGQAQSRLQIETTSDDLASSF